MTFTTDVNANARKDIRAQVPKAVCENTANNVAGVLLINYRTPPFDKPKIRRAIALALDRKEFIKATQGNGILGGIMMPPPYGVWGLTPEQLEAVPGFGKNVERNRAEARKLMAEEGYGPNNKLKTHYVVRLSSPDWLTGASLVADQLRSIYIEGEIEQQEYTVLMGTYAKGAFTMAFHQPAASSDDPDVMFYQQFKCGSQLNYSHYCNRDVEANGIYTHHRMEDVWLDK